VQMSTTRSSFDQYRISHKTISYRAVCCTRPWSPPPSAPWHNLQLCPSSQQILATPLCRRINTVSSCSKLSFQAMGVLYWIAGNCSWDLRQNRVKQAE